MKKKGFFFTLGITLFALVIFSLATTTYKNLTSYDDRFIELIALNRMGDLDSSLQNSIKEIFETTSNIDVSIDGFNINFEQDLPLNATGFNQSIIRLKNYVEANDKDVILNITDKLSNLTLQILPQGILYTQEYTQNSIIINPQPSINGFYITLAMQNNNVSSCSSTTTGGSTNLSIIITGTNGSSCSLLDNVDIDGNNQLSANDVSVITMAGKMNITTISTEVQVNTQIRVQNLTRTEIMGVYMTDDIIDIELAEIGISKKSTVRLA